MIVDFALRLATNTTSGYRWRRCALIATSLCSVWILLLAAASFQMILREQERLETRRIERATDYSETDVWVLERDDQWDNQQFSVVWLAPASDQTPVLPPGLEEMPDPGTFAVSPAIERLVRSQPDLAIRYQDRIMISSQGLVHGGELLVYARPYDDSLLRKPEVGAIRVAQFGPDPNNPAAGFAIGTIDVVDVRFFALLIGLFIVLPAVILLIAGTFATCDPRKKQLTILNWLGFSRGQLLSIGVTDVLLWCGATLPVCALIWNALNGSIHAFPGIPYEPIRNDLELSPFVVVSLWAFVIAILASASVASTILDLRIDTHATRPVLKPKRLTPLRLAPLAGGVAVVIGSQINLNASNRSGQDQLYPLLVGIACVVLGVPIALPLLTKPCGQFLARRENVATWLAGRFIEFDPIAFARTYAAAGLLLITSQIGFTFLAYTSASRAAANEYGSDQVFKIRWVTSSDEDIDRLAAELSGQRVLPMIEANGLIYVRALCTDLSAFRQTIKCDQDDSTLSESERAAIAQFLILPAPMLELGEPASRENYRDAIVLSALPPRETDRDIRAYAMNNLTAPTIQSLSTMRLRPSPQDQWIYASTLLCSVVLSFVSFFAVIDMSLKNRRRRFGMIKLSLSPSQLKRLEFQAFAAPFLVVALCGLWLGFWLSTVIASVLNGPIPWTSMLVAAFYSATFIVTSSLIAIHFRTDGDRQPFSSSNQD